MAREDDVVGVRSSPQLTLTGKMGKSENGGRTFGKWGQNFFFTFPFRLTEKINLSPFPLYEQFKNGHFRDAVLNSIVAVFDFVRARTGLKEDGTNLIGKAFSVANPYLILSEIESDSGKNDQIGFLQIFQGAYQGIRNPKAHTLSHDLNKYKAAQYLVFASLLARRIEEAKVIKKD